MHSILPPGALDGKPATTTAVVPAVVQPIQPLSSQETALLADLPQQRQKLLATIATRIGVEQRTCLALATKTVEHARKCGELLLHAKKLVQHGGWEEWLSLHFDGSQQTATAYMRIASRWESDLAPKLQSIVGFGIGDAIKALSVPRSKEPSSAPAKGGQEIIAEPEATTTVASSKIIDVAPTAVTCPTCGGHEVDGDGDCVTCREPDVGGQQNVVPEPAPPKRTGKMPVGVTLANEALNLLMRIPKNDPLRKRGFQVVMDWIRREGQQ